MKNNYLIIILLSVSAMGSCVKHDIKSDNIICDNFQEVSFESQIKPIIESNCALSGCHNGDNGPNRNWLIFSNFQAKASNVKYRITLPSGHPDHMPRIGSLSSDQVQRIVCWVEQGAKDN